MSGCFGGEGEICGSFNSETTWGKITEEGLSGKLARIIEFRGQISLKQNPF